MSSTDVPCPGRSGTSTYTPRAANLSANGLISYGDPVNPCTTRQPTSAPAGPIA